jgi:hypothetical protein
MPETNAPTKTDQAKKKAPESKSPSPISADVEKALSAPNLQAALSNPQNANPQTILRLQRLAGNRAVVQLVGRTGSSRQSTSKNEIQTGLPGSLKAGVETLSGFSMDDVQVHYNSSEPAGLQALAFTEGTNIHMAPGQEQHLPHEAWHVVQQKQGIVTPGIQEKGVNINADPALESEADVMGAEASHIAAAGPAQAQQSQPGRTTWVIQRAMPPTPVRQYLFGWFKRIVSKAKAKFGKGEPTLQPEEQEPSQEQPQQEKSPKEKLITEAVGNLMGVSVEEFGEDIVKVSNWLGIDPEHLIELGLSEKEGKGGWRDFMDECLLPKTAQVNQIAYLHVVSGMFGASYGKDVTAFKNTPDLKDRPDVIPAEVLAGVDGKEGQEKLDVIFENFNKLDFTYTPGLSMPPLSGYLSRTGDCGTLAEMFEVAARQAGISGAKVDGEHKSRLVAKAKVHGGAESNEMNGKYWAFGDHTWVNYNNSIYDLLFMKKGSAVPATYRMMGTGEHKGCKYNIYEGDHYFIDLPNLMRLGMGQQGNQGIAFDSLNELKGFVNMYR